MIKNLLHITLLSYVWKRYKMMIISTVALFAYFWLIGKIHEDFINYARLNANTQYIGLSFALKWLAFFVGFIVYFVLNTRYLGSGKHKKRAKAAASEPPEKPNAEADEDDPFEAIRKKAKLRSAADFLIEKKQR